MSGRTEDIDFAAPQRIAANLIASTLCSDRTEALLDAQADMLKGVGTAMTEWLQRRQEALLDAQRLVARMRESRDIAEIWRAQQDWAAGALQRFAADMSTYPALLATSGRRVAEETKRTAAEVAQPAKPSPVEPAPRFAEPSKPVTARPPRAVAGESARESARAATQEEAHAH
jgi:hypothetical protein